MSTKKKCLNKLRNRGIFLSSIFSRKLKAKDLSKIYNKFSTNNRLLLIPKRKCDLKLFIVWLEEKKGLLDIAPSKATKSKLEEMVKYQLSNYEFINEKELENEFNQQEVNEPRPQESIKVEPKSTPIESPNEEKQEYKEEAGDDNFHEDYKNEDLSWLDFVSAYYKK